MPHLLFFFSLVFIVCQAPKLSAQSSAEELILQDPVGEYQKFQARLAADGANASFPEFKPVVDHLKSELQTPEFAARIEQHPALALELAEVLTMLTHVNVDFTFDNAEIYPYGRPFPGPFPYRPTIDAIESALRLWDKAERLTNPKAVPLYHFDRYAYHRHTLLADPDVVIFPTMKALSFQDLILVRSVPIGFVGVVTETTRVDRHWQSPLDFWYHDLNHVRRMCAYLALRAKKLGAKSIKQKLAYYRSMDKFITSTLIPAIQKPEASAGPEELAMRRLIRVIIFEIVHETALTAEPETLTADLLRGPDVPQPFEHMMPRAGFDKEKIESLRTGTGNLQSGAGMMNSQNGEDANQTLFIRYFHDRALALLANVYNKMNYGFFDDPKDPKGFVAPVAYRKAAFVAKAAARLLKLLGHSKIPTQKELEKLVLSKKGAEEKFVYERLFPHEGDQGKVPEATEPLTADEVVAQVRALAAEKGKRIYTLFGYSELGYEHKRKSMALVRKELEALDPAEYIICIGATEVGIGAAYEIAHELGFDTIGIVSTKALTYAGKFSPFVDKIYIVNDMQWGGLIAGTGMATPATDAFVRASDVISAHGGGANTAAALQVAWHTHVELRFQSAEMNHEKFAAQAQQYNHLASTSYFGAGEEAWIKLNQNKRPVPKAINPICESTFSDGLK